MGTTKRLGLLLLVAAACSTGSSTDEDGGSDASLMDSPHSDGASDATADVRGADAAMDVTVDAPEPTTHRTRHPTTRARRGNDDADTDASDGGGIVIDGGGKGCMGILCIKGDTCCNIKTSVHYGMCEPTACLACCM